MLLHGLHSMVFTFIACFVQGISFLRAVAMFAQDVEKKLFVERRVTCTSPEIYFTPSRICNIWYTHIPWQTIHREYVTYRYDIGYN